MIEILYSDDTLAVVVKPIGYISEDGERSVPSLIREALGKPDTYVGTVHRLDKNVGGLMVYSLRRDMTGKLTEALASPDAGKEYLALLSGVPSESEDTLTDLLYYDRGKNKTYVVKRKRAGVKEAKLSYKTVRTEDGRALVSVKLYTGRTHQIRAQFASRSLPLVGDSRYGGGKGDPMLYSYRLTFTHPKNGKKMEFERNPEWY
ncbi:MAG: RluA family pseudouridine synthase [Clostridia bacterium]|nr:RluA family pseudouridine synthase [Clostridia bacterium]